MRLVLLLSLLVLAGASFQAFVHGSIHSEGLEELNGTVVRIEGPFSYQLVVKDSDYSLFLPEGEYRISASRFDEGGRLALYAEQEVAVGSQDQEVDLVLRPPDDSILLYAGVLLTISVLFIWSNRFWGGTARPGQRARAIPVELDDGAKRVLAALEASDGRATQKELRQGLRFSDSKLSLILTELEQLGYEKRFKRGRANIVRKL